MFDWVLNTPLPYSCQNLMGSDYPLRGFSKLLFTLREFIENSEQNWVEFKRSIQFVVFKP